MEPLLEKLRFSENIKDRKFAREIGNSLLCINDRIRNKDFRNITAMNRYL